VNDKDSLGTITEAILERYSGFIAGSSAAVDKLIRDGRNIIVGVTDRYSEDTLYEAQKVANGRQVYFPQHDGTWLGVKGAGQCNNPDKPPFYAEPRPDIKRFEGLAWKNEAIRAGRAALVQKKTDGMFVNYLGYRRIYALPDGTGGYISSEKFKDTERNYSETVLIFNRVLSPHRVVKFPQLLKTDPGLNHLSKSVSKALAGVGRLDHDKVLSPQEMLDRMVSEIGRIEAIKQNKGLFKQSHNEQDLTFAGEESDNEEVVGYDDYLAEIVLVDLPPSVKEAFQRYGLNLRDIFIKMRAIVEIVKAAAVAGQDKQLFPKKLLVLKALFDKYFQNLDDRWLLMWTRYGYYSVPVDKILSYSNDAEAGQKESNIERLIHEWAEAEYDKREMDKQPDQAGSRQTAAAKAGAESLPVYQAVWNGDEIKGMFSFESIFQTNGEARKRLKRIVEERDMVNTISEVEILKPIEHIYSEDRDETYIFIRTFTPDKRDYGDMLVIYSGRLPAGESIDSERIKDVYLEDDRYLFIGSLRESFPVVFKILADKCRELNLKWKEDLYIPIPEAPGSWSEEYNDTRVRKISETEIEIRTRGGTEKISITDDMNPDNVTIETSGRTLVHVQTAPSWHLTIPDIGVSLNYGVFAVERVSEKEIDVTYRGQTKKILLGSEEKGDQDREMYKVPLGVDANIWLHYELKDGALADVALKGRYVIVYKKGVMGSSRMPTVSKMDTRTMAAARKEFVEDPLLYRLAAQAAGISISNASAIKTSLMDYLTVVAFNDNRTSSVYFREIDENFKERCGHEITHAILNKADNESINEFASYLAERRIDKGDLLKYVRLYYSRGGYKYNVPGAAKEIAAHIIGTVINQKTKLIIKGEKTHEGGVSIEKKESGLRTSDIQDINL